MSALWAHLLIFLQRQKKFLIVSGTIVSLKSACVREHFAEIRVHFLQRVQLLNEIFLVEDLLPPQTQRLGLRRQHDIHRQELMYEIPVNYPSDLLKSIKIGFKLSVEVCQVDLEPLVERNSKFHDGDESLTYLSTCSLSKQLTTTEMRANLFDVRSSRIRPTAVINTQEMSVV
jgi:hypothetical protein